MSGKVAPSRRSVTLFRGSTVSCHSLSYFVDVPVPGKRCVSERKNILNGVRQDLRQSVLQYRTVDAIYEVCTASLDRLSATVG